MIIHKRGLRFNSVLSSSFFQDPVVVELGIHTLYVSGATMDYHLHLPRLFLRIVSLIAVNTISPKPIRYFYHKWPRTFAIELLVVQSHKRLGGKPIHEKVFYTRNDSCITMLACLNANSSAPI
ncbi:hypothetical protein [Sphaerochaeta halotolerans]|uniref:hypothetical protein n=1 Tax=Sphaerochaeta halotolerans TaxID=2293840 RepID=UPI0010586255|nr:hypothetical protein [Sphaerochaeta halotolerans]MBG0767474.1 hypothetical protein [Spirochaetaceae bacterium]MXI86520.1 hypothetical protein [Sphaerochaeta halotolerans]